MQRPEKAPGDGADGSTKGATRTMYRPITVSAEMQVLTGPMTPVYMAVTELFREALTE